MLNTHKFLALRFFYGSSVCQNIDHYSFITLFRGNNKRLHNQKYQTFQIVYYLRYNQQLHQIIYLYFSTLAYIMLLMPIVTYCSGSLLTLILKEVPQPLRL